MLEPIVSKCLGLLLSPKVSGFPNVAKTVVDMSVIAIVDNT